MIEINKAINKKTITKLTNANNIFNLMKGELNKNPQLKTFVLDFSGISTCSKHVFKEVIRLMQSKLNGEYRVELRNANPMVAISFNTAVKEKGAK